MHNLPAPVTRVIDRSDRVGALPAQLPGRRFITIVGPGGIGKSTVALAVAEGLIEGYDHGVRFVDLAQIRDPLQVPGALVDALGLEIRSDDPIPELIASLQARQCCSCSITASMSSRLNDLRDRRRGR
jgi:predicted ATPase